MIDRGQEHIVSELQQGARVRSSWSLTSVGRADPPDRLWATGRSLHS